MTLFRPRLSSPVAAGFFAFPAFERRAVFTHEETSESVRTFIAPISILIVEDDFLVAAQAETALRDAGYDLAGVAISAEEAVEIAVSQSPALAVMDVRLAGRRDGIDCALELFQRLALRSIFATAHDDRDVRKRAGPAHPLGWLPKPYTMMSLIAAVEKALIELGHATR